MNREVAEDISADVINFPSLEEYKAGLQSLVSMELDLLSYEELSQLFYKRAIVFQQAYGINPPEYFNQRTFYRVRFKVGQNEDTGLLRTYSYPPPTVCKENGRANLKGKSVFYCSEHPGGAILESKPEAGEIGYLTLWKGNAQRGVKYGICLPRELRTENAFRKMAVDIEQFCAQESVKAARNKAEHLTFFYKFIADRFANEKPPYPLTSWIANEMLFESQSKDYIIYPSLAHYQYTCNLAFHPNSADTLLQFMKVWKFRLIEVQGPNIVTTEHQIGELDGSHLKWRKPYTGELAELMPGGRYV